MSEKKAPTTAATTKSVKKSSTAKKSVTKKKVSSKEKSTGKASAARTVGPGVQSIIEEMNEQRQSRDKQISSLIKEVRDGFNILSANTSTQGEAHQKEMTALYQSLQSTFGKIKEGSVENEEQNLNIFTSLSDSMMKDHEQTLKEINGQAELQDKKIEHMSKMLEQRTGRNRMIAIPGGIIGIVGVLYMFYVVTIMESAMSNMSANMHHIQKDVGSMSGNMGELTHGIISIDSNMQQLNGNVGYMANDLNVLTHNVAPVMRGMRNVMPWAP